MEPIGIQQNVYSPTSIRLGHSQSVHFKRIIPGCRDLEVNFCIDPVNQSISVEVKKNNEILKQNVPIKNFQTNNDGASFRESIQTLQTVAIDYVVGQIILLPGDVLTIIRELKNQDGLSITIEVIEENERIFENTQWTQNSETVDVYYTIGCEYFHLCMYTTALLLFQQMFQIAERIRDRSDIRLAHRSLGNVYFALGETDRAMSHVERELVLLDDLIRLAIWNQEAKALKEEKAGALTLLGDLYDERGDHKKAVELYKKSGALFLQDSVQSRLAMAYLNLGELSCAEEELGKCQENGETLNTWGLIYNARADYRNAIEMFKKALKMEDQLVKRGQISANLGLAYENLGRRSKAYKYHKLDLGIAIKIESSASQARAYYNLSALYMKERNLDKCRKYIRKISPLMESLADLGLMGMIEGLKGRIYFHKGKLDKSLACDKKQLKIARKTGDLEGQIASYQNLAKTHSALGSYGSAIEMYQTAMEIAEQMGDNGAKADLLCNLGRTYYFMQGYTNSIPYFQNSINVCEELSHKNCSDSLQWKISFFETQFRAYRGLEQAKLRQDTEKALLVADSSRSRALSGLLEEKLNTDSKQELAIDDVKAAAKRFQATIVMYSCNPFDDTKGWCWVICPAGQITYRELEISKISEQIETTYPANQPGPSKDWIATEMERSGLQNAVSKWRVNIEEKCRGGRRSETKHLKEWYSSFIAPINDLLPATEGDRIILIPDAFLHDIAFALLQDPDGKYLFEKYTLILTPSITTLLRLESIDNKNIPNRNQKNICVIANPKSNSERQLPPLEGAEEEGKLVAESFHQIFPKTPSLTTEDFNMRASQAGHIHFACHGLADEQKNKHSVFEGALVMADRLLYAEDIRKLPLNAELAFLGACDSGHGRIYREGSVGLPFAFLAAGASSVIATRWAILDRKTAEIVKNFYQHYVGESGKANAARALGKPYGQAECLREAMLFAKSQYPDNPEIWGAFFLVGLPGNIQKSNFTDPLTKFKVDKITRDRFLFRIKEGKMLVTSFGKECHEFPAEEYLEADILVRTISFAQLQREIPQVTKSVCNLTESEKIEIIHSLPRRPRIFLEDGRVIIGQET